MVQATGEVIDRVAEIHQAADAEDQEVGEIAVLAEAGGEEMRDKHEFFANKKSFRD